MPNKEDMISPSFKKCGITLALNGSENADLNTKRLEDCKMSSAEEAYEFQLQRESSRGGTRRHFVLFYFISFEVLKILMLRKLLYLVLTKNPPRL